MNAINQSNTNTKAHPHHHHHHHHHHAILQFKECQSCKITVKPLYISRKIKERMQFVTSQPPFPPYNKDGKIMIMMIISSSSLCFWHFNCINSLKKMAHTSSDWWIPRQMRHLVTTYTQ